MLPFNSSYLGILENSINQISIVGYQELDKTLTKNPVGFDVMLNTLYQGCVVENTPT